MRRLFPLAAAAFIGATLLSCGGSGDSTAPPVLTTLSVSFPTGTVQVGQTAVASVAGLDQHGASIFVGTISWSTADPAVATVDANGLVRGLGPGQTQVIANAGGKQAQTLVTVIPAPVASVTVAPPSATLVVGANQQLTPTTLDGSGNVLTGRVVTWVTSDQTRATVSSTGMVAAVAAGSVTITATSEGESGTSQITVNNSQASCTGASLQLAVGELHTLTTAERASLCLGGGASATEYVLIPFNNSTSAALTIPIQITGTGTAAIQPGSLASVQPASASRSGFKQGLSQESFEWAFRERELRDLGPVLAKWKQRGGSTLPAPGVNYLTGFLSTIAVGDVVQINANLSGNLCTAAKELHAATVAAVLPHTLVLVDNQSPANGYTPAELTAFAQAFDTLGYALDVQNFGAPSDFDGDSRIAILFTPSVNQISFPGGIVLGLFTARDLFPANASNCIASNEGEMFYLPVPDLTSTFNGRYTDKASLSNTVLGTLVHEFQHLINAGRRIYVNNASSFEDVWLNEGLSHIAEELLYYRVSGNPPRTNIDVNLLRSTQAQRDAVNTYQLNNLGRLSTYMSAPETNSPFSQIDGLEMRGAIWQLLRYSADRKGGLEQTTWSALVNSSVAGQENFNNVFGDIITMTRDWAIAQFTDDAGFGLSPNFSNPSWNFRSIMPAITSGGAFPLHTRALLSSPLDIPVLNGGGAAYVRFSVAANAPAIIGATSSGQAVPSVVEFFLLRTQ